MNKCLRGRREQNGCETAGVPCRQATAAFLMSACRTDRFSVPTPVPWACPHPSPPSGPPNPHASWFCRDRVPVPRNSHSTDAAKRRAARKQKEIRCPRPTGFGQSASSRGLDKDVPTEMAGGGGSGHVVCGACAAGEHIRSVCLLLELGALADEQLRLQGHIVGSGWRGWRARGLEG